MIPTETPTTSPTPAPSPSPATPMTPPASSPLPPLFTFKRWGSSSRKSKRARSEDVDLSSGTAGGEDDVLRRSVSIDDGMEVEDDGLWEDDGLRKKGRRLSIPAARPLVRARSSKVKLKKVETLSSSSSTSLELARTISPDSPEPTAKRVRQRSSSTSSTSSMPGLTGVLFEGNTPSSPSTSPEAPVDATMPLPARPPTRPPQIFSYIPSPLATAPVMSPTLSPPTPSSPAAPQLDLPLSVPLPLPVSPREDAEVIVAAAQVTKSKAFWRDVEDLGAELGNVLKLGFGRGMNRGAGGQRKPSRLRSSLIVDEEAGREEERRERYGRRDTE
ncbi:hypothetical protein B9479_005781 [Cryptococcus floricola]|uniref:Uncharacterized protein n=1 Tax=Cryptococcus floricola TaxID=2591691 RepID=A0A5D3AUV6_9TREE|nr:hypothetical protein B9479_005781 [Cryptococcus floricola]